MTEPTAAASGSVRVQLARVALDAALAVDGVLAPDAGPGGHHVTVSGATILRGVGVAAEPQGRYSVDLGLSVRLVPLPALAEAVRERVTRAVRLAGLSEVLGTTNVAFHDLVGDDELAAAAIAATAPVAAAATTAAAQPVSVRDAAP